MASDTYTDPAVVTASQFRDAMTTSIAATLAVWLARSLGLPQPYWAAISALIVMQSDVRRTMRASGDRLLGTAIGAVIGGLFVGFAGHSLAVFAVAAAATIMVCGLLRIPGGPRLSAVTVAIVMLTDSTAPAWRIALNRSTEVAFGIVVAVMLHAIVESFVKTRPGALVADHDKNDTGVND